MPETQLDQAALSAPPRSGQKVRVRGWAAALRLTLLSFTIFAASPAWAQSVLDVEEDLDFDRPEAWALKYFSAATLFTGFGAPAAGSPWSLELAIEGGWLPTLSEEDRKVGFYGEKVEDLNKTSVFGRLRADLSLPGKLTLTAGYVPAVEVGGARPNIFSLALGRPLLERPRFSLGVRLFALRGTIESDITCDRETVSLGPDPIRNPFLCEQPSQDEVTLQSLGGEFSFAWQASPKLQPYLSMSVAAIDPEFQINARYNGLIDRTHQQTDGTLYAFQAGLSYRATERLRLSSEVFFAPLEVEPRLGADVERRDLVNVRLLLRYRLRS